MSNITSAKEARHIVEGSSISKNLDDLMDYIRQEAKQGRTSLNYSGNLAPNQVTFLLTLGYKVHWNRACLWYEVDWS